MNDKQRKEACKDCLTIANKLIQASVEFSPRQAKCLARIEFNDVMDTRECQHVTNCPVKTLLRDTDDR